MLVLGDPEDVNTFLSDPNALQKPYIYNFVKNERGLVTSARECNFFPVKFFCDLFLTLSAHVWKVHRKILNPSFSFNVLKHLIPLFKEKVDKLISEINERDHEKEIDMLNVSATGVEIDTKSQETLC